MSLKDMEFKGYKLGDRFEWDGSEYEVVGFGMDCLFGAYSESTLDEEAWPFTVHELPVKHNAQTLMKLTKAQLVEMILDADNG